MLPDLTILIAILVGLNALVASPTDPLRALGGTAASVCVGVAMTWMAGERGVRAVREKRIETAVASARWIGLWPLIGWFVAVTFFDWGSFIAVEIPRAWWLGRFAILFAPALVLFAAGWIQHARVADALASARGGVLPSGGARLAIRQGLRRNAIALLPMFFILGLLEGIWLLGDLGVPVVKELSRWLDAMPLLALGLMFGILALLSFFLPAVLRRVIPTEPLPPGPVRDRLERHAAAMNLRYRDLLVWKTTGRVLNAMVVGFTPRTRIIFLTDALLRHLPEEEVLAVFSHEAGHAKRYHLPLFLVLFVTTGVIFHVAGDLLAVHGVPQEIVIALHLVFLWFVLLGVISRQFEREADVYGANHAASSSPAPHETVVAPGLGAPLPVGAAWMIRALERIRLLSGRGESHRHGSIEDRVRYVAAYATTPGVRDTFVQTHRRLLRLILLSVLVATALLAWRLPGDFRLARSWMSAEDAGDAYAAGTAARRADREAEARGHWERAYDGFRRSVTLLAGDDGLRAEGLGFLSRFNAADSAFHGLDDEARGRKGFEETLRYAEQSDLPPEGTRAIRFHAHVDLGRILVHAGDPTAYDHWPRARATFPPGEAEAETFYRARLRLLRAVLLAAYDDGLEPPAGTDLDDLGVERGGRGYRAMLLHLAQRGEGGVEWDELRRDARRELERMVSSSP